MQIGDGYTLSGLAEALGKPTSTIDVFIRAGIASGLITPHHSACGKTTLYDLAEVRAVAAARKPPGRPRKKPAVDAE